ncbi:hypothetical protein EXS71_02985 [Candidatus Uhrbacteria bacterium]|nr:hypothetical protein [Candidatus Uhrbacteria bacterium]
MVYYPQELHDTLVLNQEEFVWEAPAHIHHERGPGWYAGMVVIALFFVAYAIWTANFLFAFLILLIAIILLLAGHDEPRKILIQIGAHGIVRDGKLYSYSDIEEFALVYQPPMTKMLYIEPASSMRPRLRIPLEDQDPVQIRDHLRQFLKEDLDLQGEHFSDIIARLLRI